MSSSRYVANPSVSIITTPGGLVELDVRNHSLLIVANPLLVQMLEFLRTPRSMAEFLEAFDDASPQVLQALQDNLLVFAEVEAPCLASGFLARPREIVSVPFNWPTLTSSASESTVVLFGVPYDHGLTHASATRDGPAAIRRSLAAILPRRKPHHKSPADSNSILLDTNLRREVPLESLQVADIGDIARDSDTPSSHIAARVQKVIRHCITCGSFPIMLGGDHSITWFAISEFLDGSRDVGIIHFDAHTDRYNSGTNVPQTLTHANPFSFALQKSSLAVLHQVGIREYEVIPTDMKVSTDKRVSITTALEATSLSPENVFAHLPVDLPYYITFDVDCIDPSFAPDPSSTVALCAAGVERRFSRGFCMSAEDGTTNCSAKCEYTMHEAALD